jgi:hypothetical protein
MTERAGARIPDGAAAVPEFKEKVLNSLVYFKFDGSFL